VPPGSGSQPVPEQATNAIASLRPFDTEVEVAGQWVRVPARPAVDWLEQLMGDIELFMIFPGFCDPEDADFVDECLRTGEVTTDEVDGVTLTLIETASGRPWWTTLRMIHIAEQRWGILGSEMTRLGIDPTRISLAAWLDVLWPMFFRYMDEQKWTTFAAQIEVPPPQEAARDSIDTMEMSTDSFTSLMRG
jgi:hypothetical protein